MTSKGGRPRTFPTGIVLLAVERRERTDETWAELGRTLNVNPGTLRARVGDFRREGRVHKTPAAPSDGDVTSLGASSTLKEGGP
jgi:hypothetical protein